MAAQAMHNYGFLPEQSQEDALHATRLLAVEERPFQRVTKSLLGKDSLLRKLPIHLPSSPLNEGDEQSEVDPASEPFRLQAFREEILLDFAALESSILRIQLLQSSNQRERERYAAEKAKILDTAQAVRENTVELRAQLEEAQKVLERRKGYDELAAKILDDKKLKSREECAAEIEGLEKEIEELRVESSEVEVTWAGRREGFERVVGEGEALVRVIKGVKDEPEQEHADGDVDESMEDGDGDDATRGESSRLGTPTPAGGRTPMMHAEGGETPMQEQEDETHADASKAPTNKFLDVEDAMRAGSRTASPSRRAKESDVEMVEPEQVPPPKNSVGMEASVQQVADAMDET
ncbi:hypothetical protein BAUCODRAFT_148853 [Baudoinia panamericana UAMH 10762]|uniref:Uncharacterized protein n=1 Tax=Baudoinia panamericana (strain UAMH 10762) TaxID=717646 RepID=M2NB04_BAUPA|nr:uncharacterized protein BAUCODRAFT_148853 [Baudoinia panamericana UAMH 10762]EMC96015.1 hypothetical protein BAUCODRAFT_148853 [Baudoinia panamericana UAMH 10762]